jgi:hypothetical protein
VMVEAGHFASSISAKEIEGDYLIGVHRVHLPTR